MDEKSWRMLCSPSLQTLALHWAQCHPLSAPTLFIHPDIHFLQHGSVGRVGVGAGFSVYV